MRHAQETTLHELYLRASSMAKKTAPLKLYANVVSKFTVERELHDDVCDKLRESTQDAVNQRMTRTTQFINVPQDIQSNSKKRKEPPSPSSMFRKPIRQSDKLMPTSNLPIVPNRTSTLTPQGSKEGSMSLRPRVLHCLAIADRTEDDLVRLVGGVDCSPLLRREIHDLLEQVSESCPIVSLEKADVFSSWQLHHPMDHLLVTLRNYIISSWFRGRKYVHTCVLNCLPQSDPQWLAPPGRRFKS